MSADTFEAAARHARAVKTSTGSLQTEEFLATCRLVVSVVEKLGTAFFLVRQDINGNIERLAGKLAVQPEQFSDLRAIVQEELNTNQHAGSSSCTKGLLWLKRAMEFTVALLRRASQDTQTPLYTIVSEAYTATLAQYHGWIVSSTFTVAFQFVPTRESFIQELGGHPEVLYQQMTLFVEAFSPVLAEIHGFLAAIGLDDPTKV